MKIEDQLWCPKYSNAVDAYQEIQFHVSILWFPLHLGPIFLSLALLLALTICMPFILAFYSYYIIFIVIHDSFIHIY